jgi:hypothetical protein
MALVASYSIDRGRSFELDRTDTGTARVAINDTAGVLDPTNSTGPYYGTIEPLKQMALALQHPLTLAWSTLFRGFIEDFDYDVAPSVYKNNLGAAVGVNRLNISLADAFLILSKIEMFPDGSFGDTPPAGGEADVFFDNANVDDRMLQVLGNAGWPVPCRRSSPGTCLFKRRSTAPGTPYFRCCRRQRTLSSPVSGTCTCPATGR